MTDPSSLLARLAAAFHGTDVVEVRDEEIPADLDAAERIEDALMATLGPIGGFKLGATIPAVKRDLGLPRAFFGAVPASRLFPDGAEIPAMVVRQRGVECEYAFRLGADLPDEGPLDPAELWAAIETVHPAIEIPGTRFERLARYGGLGLVADAGAVGALVLGPGVAARDLPSLGAGRVTLQVEGEAPLVGDGSAIEGGPIGPLPAFVVQARARRVPLRRGQVVATGSCTGYTLVEAGRRVEGRFDALGASVAMRFATST